MMCAFRSESTSATAFLARSRSSAGGRGVMAGCRCWLGMPAMVSRWLATGRPSLVVSSVASHPDLQELRISQGLPVLKKPASGDFPLPLPVPTVMKALRDLVEPMAVARFVVSGEPASKSRARFTKQYSAVLPYTPENIKQAEHVIASQFKKACPHWTVDPDGTFGVLAIFHAQTFQRRDVDNMLKLILDGLTGTVWEDDVQVAEVSGRVERGVTDPHSEVFIYLAQSNGTPPNATCQNCGRKFRTYASWAGKKFCSEACSNVITRIAATRTCKGCAATYAAGPYEINRLYCSPDCRQRKSTVDLACVQCGRTYTQWTSWRPSGAALCSRECSVTYWRQNGTKYHKGSCAECGAPTSRKEYRRCRACARIVAPERTRAPKKAAARTVLPVGTINHHPRAFIREGTPEWDARRGRALAFIADALRDGLNPRLADIRAAIEVPALGTVRLMLTELDRDGWLTREKKQPFRFTLLRPIEEPTDGGSPC